MEHAVDVDRYCLSSALDGMQRHTNTPVLIE